MNGWWFGPRFDRVVADEMLPPVRDPYNWRRHVWKAILSLVAVAVLVGLSFFLPTHG